MASLWNKNDPEKSIVFLDRKQLINDYPEMASKSLLKTNDPIHLCRVMLEKDVVSGTFLVPDKTRPIKTKNSFGFMICDNTLYFIKDHDGLEEMVHTFVKRYDLVYESPMDFLLGFMNYLIQEDIYYLEDYTEKLEDVEEALFEHRENQMEKFIMQTRKDMNTLNNYYLQLSAVKEVLSEIVLEQNSQVTLNLLSLYDSRVRHLLTMVETIKDYSNQIWDLKQTQLSERQNSISTLLTMVTSIFLPMTLISGIFGMNFVNMPLIRHPLGFWISIGICALIGAAEVIVLYRHRWFK